MNKQLVIGIGVGLVILGSLFAWLRLGSNTNTQESSSNLSNESNTTSGTNTGMMVEDNAIYAIAQANSQTATTSMVVLTKPGYVAIHVDMNGKPGKIIGSSTLLNSGKSDNIQIELSRKTETGEMIYAMLHVDNGDGVFTEADQPVLGKNGEPMMMNVMVEDTNSTGAVSL